MPNYCRNNCRASCRHKKLTIQETLCPPLPQNSCCPFNFKNCPPVYDRRESACSLAQKKLLCLKSGKFVNAKKRLKNRCY